MKILFLYTRRMLSANKARTAVTLAGIILSFALLTAVLTGTSSLLHFMTEFTKLHDGDYYGVIYNCDEPDEKRLVESSEVTQSIRMGIVGTAKKGFGEEASLFEKAYVTIGSVDASYYDTMGVKILKGRFPENDSEIIVPQMMVAGREELKVGNTITWQIGQRIGSDGRAIDHQTARRADQNTENSCEEESILVEQTKTYTIVGISTNPGYVKPDDPSFLVLTTGEKTARSDLYFKMKKIDTVSTFATENFGDHEWAVNESLLRYLGRSSADMRYALFGMCAVLAVVIAIASVGLIYNSFSISLTERTRQFGLLKSIGATRFQIIMSVLLEAGFLALTAIPAGILIGCGGVQLVLSVLKSSFDGMIRSADEVYAQSISITFYTQIGYLFVAVIVGLITILLSAMIPAIRAGRITPIEAIRQTNDIKIANVKDSQSKNGLLGKLFGVGGMIAHRNAKRNRKPYRAICFSLATCLFLFLGGSGFIYYMRLSVKGLNVPYYYDYTVVFGNQYDEAIDEQYRTQEFHEKLVDQLNASSSIDQATYIRKTNLKVTAPESELTKVGKLELGQYIVNGQLYYQADIYFVEEKQYEQYLKQIGLEPSEYLRADNPKALILNATKGAIDFENGRRKFYEGTVFKDASELTNISITGQKRIGNAWHAYQDPDDPNTMIYIEGDGKNAKTEDDLTKIKVPLEESIEALPFEIGETIDADKYPYWAWAGNWAFVLPLSAYPEEAMMDLNTQDCIYITAIDLTRTLELITQLQKDTQGAFQIGTKLQNNIYEDSIMRILNVCLQCFLLLITLISLANIANTITTSVRLRTREYAMIRSVGCSKRTFLCMIAAENLSYTLRGFVIGACMGCVANYACYHYLQSAIYTNQVIPIHLYGIGAVAFAFVLGFSVVYTWKKVQRGQISEELRKEAF